MLIPSTSRHLGDPPNTFSCPFYPLELGILLIMKDENAIQRKQYGTISWNMKQPKRKKSKVRLLCTVIDKEKT